MYQEALVERMRGRELHFLLYPVRLRDPTEDEPRLLKLKDWPPGDDFSEKLPRRYACNEAGSFVRLYFNLYFRFGDSEVQFFFAWFIFTSFGVDSMT